MTTKQIKNTMTWLNSLHNKEFNQTQECLKDDKGHCCLGVAIELFDSFSEDSDYLHQQLDQMPNTEWWIKTFGWTDVMKFTKDKVILSALNDEWGRSFPKIAEIVFKSDIGDEIKIQYNWEPGDEIPKEL